VTLEHQLRQQADTRHLIFWHYVRAMAVLDFIGPSESKAVTDVGAGAGSLGWILREKRPNARYTFFEPMDTLAKQLRDEFGPDNELRSLADLGNADVVTLLDVIEHVEDDRELLFEVARSMAPGAHLVVTVPALPVLWSQWDVDLGHHRRYMRRQLRELVRGLPLGVSEVRYLFPELLPPALIRRVRGSGATHEFPVLPRTVDEALRVVGSASYRGRRLWPAGTSLVLRARRL
jgi:hypothetical protein